MTTTRVDPAAYRAAYNVLSRTVPLAQVRGEVAERVAKAVLERRTKFGIGSLHPMTTDREFAAAVATTELMPNLPEVWTSVKLAALTDAVHAAARALFDGTEAHQDEGGAS